jgi:hypothetical protein
VHATTRPGLFHEPPERGEDGPSVQPASALAALDRQHDHTGLTQANGDDEPARHQLGSLAVASRAAA